MSSLPVNQHSKTNHVYNALLLLRTAIFYLCWAALTLAWLLPTLLALLLPLKLRNSVISVPYCYTLAWLLRLICGVRWQIYGSEHLQNRPNACVVFSKHQSTWETFFINTVFTPQVPVVKKELSYLPVFGWILAMLKPIFIDRRHKTNALKQVIRQGKERLEQGISVSIYPEGTRVAPGLRKEFSRGGAMLACKAKAPVFAIAHNSGEHWPNTRWIKRPGTIHVVISPMFDSSSHDANSLTDAIENWINTQVDTISSIPFSGTYSHQENSGKRF